MKPETEIKNVNPFEGNINGKTIKDSYANGDTFTMIFDDNSVSEIFCEDFELCFNELDYNSIVRGRSYLVYHDHHLDEYMDFLFKNKVIDKKQFFQDCKAMYSNQIKTSKETNLKNGIRYIEDSIELVSEEDRKKLEEIFKFYK